MSFPTLELVVAVDSHHKRCLGPMIRTATVFGISILIVVGPKKYGTHGAHGSNLRLQIIHFYTWDEARSFLRSRCSNGLYYGICELSQVRSNSVKLEDYSFCNIDEVFTTKTGNSDADVVPTNGMITFCVPPYKSKFNDNVLSFLDGNLHVELPGLNNNNICNKNKIMEKLKYENIFCIVLDFYLTNIINKFSNNYKQFKDDNNKINFSGEKFTVSNSIQKGYRDEEMVSQIAKIKLNRHGRNTIIDNEVHQENDNDDDDDHDGSNADDNDSNCEGFFSILNT